MPGIITAIEITRIATYGDLVAAILATDPHRLVFRWMGREQVDEVGAPMRASSWLLTAQTFPADAGIDMGVLFAGVLALNEDHHEREDERTADYFASLAESGTPAVEDVEDTEDD